MFEHVWYLVWYAVWPHLLWHCIEIEGIGNWRKLGGWAGEGCDGYFPMVGVGIRGRSGCRLDHHSPALAQNGGQPGSRWQSRWRKGPPQTKRKYLDYFLLLLQQEEEEGKLQLSERDWEERGKGQVDLLSSTQVYSSLQQMSTLPPFCSTINLLCALFLTGSLLIHLCLSR